MPGILGRIRAFSQACSYKGKDAADELIGNVLAKAPTFGGADRLITLIVDGENAPP